MKVNMGTADRTIRFLIGIAAVSVGLYFQSWWGLIGLPLIITSLVRWCPAYDFIGMSTRSKPKPPTSKVS